MSEQREEKTFCTNCGEALLYAPSDEVKVVRCGKCGLLNSAEQGCPSLQSWDLLLAQGKHSPPLHIIISRLDDNTYLNLSRPAHRLVAIGLVAEALGMLQLSSVSMLDSSHSPLKIFITSFENSDASDT